MKRAAFLLLVFFGLLKGIAAQSGLVYIDQISIEGNRRTRDAIILRELKFHEGDSIALSELDDVLLESESLVMNTGLFSKANISFKSWESATNKVHIVISVNETWYIYPVPVFELADRNFNVWWTDQKRSLDRVNFGIEFTHLNFSGQKDRLKLTAKYGYTRSYALKYTLPYINQRQTVGIESEVSYSRNRELNYATVGNKQLFYKDPDNDWLYQRFRSEAAITYRPGYHLFHTLRLRYQQNAIDEIVAKELNPDFFLEGKLLQRFFTLSYRFAYDMRDVTAYPLKGAFFAGRVEKDGLGIFKDRDALTIETVFNKYFPLSEKWSAGLLTSAKYSFIRDKQPFTDYRALGFSYNTLYGYELYLVDGLDMGIARTFVRYRLLQNELKLGKLMPLESFRSVPIRLYLSLNGGWAYANDPYTGQDNSFANRPLWGWGPGLDVILFYNMVFQIQYSINHLSEKGIFLRLNTNI